MITLTDVKEAQPNWFSRENRRFFNDVSFKVLQGKASQQPYLVRSTYAWTDMFGKPKKLHYRINFIGADLKIGHLEDTIFDDLESIKDWLKEH